MKILSLILIPLFIVNCSAAQEADGASSGNEVIYRGENITPEGAISVSELVEMMKGKEDQKIPLKVEAKITECCQKKGCWMMVDLQNGKTMRVTFKDYGFFVPLESAGKTVIMEGIAFYKTTSVELLRHYAEDAGKSEKEIKKIKEPEHDLAFEATGLLIKK